MNGTKRKPDDMNTASETNKKSTWNVDAAAKKRDVESKKSMSLVAEGKKRGDDICKSSTRMRLDSILRLICYECRMRLVQPETMFARAPPFLFDPELLKFTIEELECELRSMERILELSSRQYLASTIRYWNSLWAVKLSAEPDSRFSGEEKIKREQICEKFLRLRQDRIRKALCCDCNKILAPGFTIQPSQSMFSLKPELMSVEELEIEFLDAAKDIQSYSREYIEYSHRINHILWAVKLSAGHFYSRDDYDTEEAE